MTTTTDHLNEALHKHFGFDNFKGNQEAIIRNLLEGKDSFVIMPTGGGKSLCYQLPALMMEGTALVISPLIALMKNQVDSIRSYSEADNVAHFLNSSLSRAQMRKVKSDIQDGHTKLLYVAPETLTKEENLDFFANTNVSFVAVDEAHCISEWGHDFRPEYRRIRTMIDAIGREIPIIALTATATPKVRTDIVKTLRMEDPTEFVSSFNRDNLYYEIRPKGKRDDTIKSILQYIKTQPKKSGIIYVQARKSAEDIAKLLEVNGIKAFPYHAGLDAKTRSDTQDAFLMEDLEVIVATIAFGMGIDKPNVRFVIHYDIPKSIENYYQETGRAGRDGLQGDCIAYYAYNDLVKLEKFLRDKPVSEREMGMQLLNEVLGYAETTSCRRQYLLHYFGEDYHPSQCNGMCDNCRYPKERVEAGDELRQALMAVRDLKENFPLKTVVEFILGKQTKQLLDFGYDELDGFGIGEEKNELFWNSVLRQALLNDYLYKDIEEYGLLKISPSGHAVIQNPGPFHITLNHDFDQELMDDEEEAAGKTAVLDDTLFQQLRDLCRREAKKMGVPPYVVFSEPSLMDMATQYPVTLEDLESVSGVNKGKAQRYGQPFVDFIARYVADNDIERPTDFVVKSIANKSKSKVQIIQSIDKRIPFEDIARSLDMSMDEFMEEIYSIVQAGTKLRIDYYIDEQVDEAIREDICDYFMQADTDDLELAFQTLKEDDITWEEVRLMRIKFLSDNGN
jgi:ATP-dependent DNA helicase RecQ